jgi:hypothetical protein
MHGSPVVDLNAGKIRCMARYATQAEAEAEKILRELLDLLPTKIEEGSTRSADFLVDGDDPPYVVEVKSRFLPKQVVDPPPNEETKPYVRSMTRDLGVRDWFPEAAEQFAAVDPSHERLWFLWCSMEGFDPDTQLERTVRTLYGARTAHDAIDLERQWPVFYSEPTIFESFPEIDGAVVLAPPDGATFCPNEFSPRLEAVLQSKLVRNLRGQGVHRMLPVERAAEMGGYVVPLSVDRKDAGAVLRHCQSALGARYLQFLAQEIEYIHTGALALPD